MPRHQKKEPSPEPLGPDAPVDNPAKKLAEPVPPRRNPVEDYTLAALNKVGEGWFVVLIHKKDRTQRIRLRPNEESESGFKLVAVENPGGRDARVKLECKGQQGWVQFGRTHISVHKAILEIPLERNYRVNLDLIRNGRARIVPTRRQSNEKTRNQSRR